MVFGIRPIVQAILVADHVYTDTLTEKKIVAGIFHSIISRKQSDPIGETGQEDQPSHLTVPVPAAGFQMGSPFAYVSLTNVRSEQEFALRYVDLSTDQARFEVGFVIKCQDPLATAELAIALPPLPSDRPGTFALELLWHDEPLGSTRIQVRIVDDPPQECGTTDDQPTDQP
jgi:hypothetical protein